MELARAVSPASVVTLEEEWGDWLASQKHMDAAINHYIEAGASIKAVEAAIADRQCAKAAGIVEFLDSGKAAPYYRRIAAQYEEANSRCGMYRHSPFSQCFFWCGRRALCGPTQWTPSKKMDFDLGLWLPTCGCQFSEQHEPGIAVLIDS